MLPTVPYSIDELKEEARQLVEEGVVKPQQPIYLLCRFIPPREWLCVEYELERNDFLLRDPIGDLVPNKEWNED